MNEFFRSALAVTIGQKSVDDAANDLRKTLVAAMRSGDNFIVGCDKSIIDFNEKYNIESVFPMSEISNYEEWRVYPNYLKVVREDEDFDLLNIQGQYVMQKTFNMSFLCRYESEEQVAEVLANIPNSDKFRVFFVNP